MWLSDPTFITVKVQVSNVWLLKERVNKKKQVIITIITIFQKPGYNNHICYKMAEYIQNALTWRYNNFDSRSKHKFVVIIHTAS